MVTVEPINKGKEQKAFDKTLMKMEKKACCNDKEVYGHFLLPSLSELGLELHGS